MKNKRGQTVFGMSYGVIFSIFVIVFIVAVAFIAIRHFMGLNSCTQIGLFYDSLQQEVERGWSSGSGRYLKNFEGSLPISGFFSSNLKEVCFGNLSATNTPFNSERQEILEFLHGDISGSENVFVYPPKEACDGNLYGIHLKCANGRSECMKIISNSFFCTTINKNGKAIVTLDKNERDVLVTVQEYNP